MFFFHYECRTLDRVYVCTGASRETAKNPYSSIYSYKRIKQSTLHTLGQECSWDLVELHSEVLHLGGLSHLSGQCVPISDGLWNK